jgi:hypothetical protein
MQVELEGIVGVQVAIEGTIVGAGAPDAAALADIEKKVLAELTKLAGDARVVMKPTGDVSISIQLEAGSIVDGAVRGSSIIRSAIHSAEVGTPGWDIDWCNVSAQRVDDPARCAEDTIPAGHNR